MGCCAWGKKAIVDECHRQGAPITDANLIRALGLAAARPEFGHERRRAVPEMFEEGIQEEIEALVSSCKLQTLRNVSEKRGLPNSWTMLGLAVYIAASSQRRGWHAEHAVDRHVRLPCVHSGQSSEQAVG